MNDLSNSIKSLEPINIPCGWFVKYHDLTVTQETVEPNTKLIELEKQRYHAAVKIMKGHDDYLIHICDNHGETIDTINVGDRRQLVDELERIIWKIEAAAFGGNIFIFEGPPDYLRLRVPQGWTVSYNKLIDIDPDQLEEDSDDWFNFTSSLLQLEHKESRLTLDVGWYIDIDPSGTFYMLLIKNLDWDNPLEDMETRRPEKLVDHIEATLQKAAEHKYK
ncbi:hypothetical protein ABE347_03515 [Bacillus paralicheniformis]|uniref:hypothetical protein n=1 Tax=Bacillus paralicheniformis TaxID=1648923 RepID=UPI003D223C3C